MSESEPEPRSDLDPIAWRVALAALRPRRSLWRILAGALGLSGIALPNWSPWWQREPVANPAESSQLIGLILGSDPAPVRSDGRQPRWASHSTHFVRLTSRTRPEVSHGSPNL